MIRRYNTQQSRENRSSYDLNELGGFRKTYKQLLEEEKHNPKPYDLGFQAQLSQARFREKRNLENNANNQ